jgi:membrane-associated protease RseP (regulator of RpoE activity)
MSQIDPIALDLLYRRGLRPSWRTWMKHILLMLVAFVTMTIAGVLWPFGMIDYLPETDPQSFSEVLGLLQRLPGAYFDVVSGAVQMLLTRPDYLKYGLSFSGSLLFILISHEMGHYIACRIYGVQATLPFFIPTPPMVGPAGTFGAFIKIQSPMPSRRAVFDIGVAGPIAGFIALIPVAIIAFSTIEQTSTQELLVLPPGSISFADPLFFRILAWIGGINLRIPMSYNAFYSAAWVGLLITALNLIPSGQLDGGHAMFAIFGKRVHYWTGRIAFVAMAALSITGWFLYGSPSGFLITVLLGIMMRIRHPEPLDDEPLDFKRKLVAAFTLLIFVLCFAPFPIQLN